MSDPLDRVLAAEREHAESFKAAAREISAMDEGERRRWDAGRHDWERERWEDHCGDPGCSHSCCASNDIPGGNPFVAVQRAVLAGTCKARGFL